MKGYLFGLGAMLVGAGLMFVLMRGEVNAEGEKGIHCEEFVSNLEHHNYMHTRAGDKDYKVHVFCKINDLTCVTNHQGISCVKS